MRSLLALLSAVAAMATPGPIVGTNRRFFAIGDWGGQSDAPYTNAAEISSANAMQQRAAQMPVDFVLMLGDNMYDSGISGSATTSPRFNATFENVFHIQVPHLITIGNHDSYGNVSAEVAYTELSSRWYLPTNYYTETVSYTGSNGQAFTLQIVNIDTTELAGLTAHDDTTTPPPGPADAVAAQSQWDWISSTLSSSTADFVLVMGHYPVWSGCEHGPTLILDTLLEPLLAKYGAMYFSGHDHCQEFIQYNGVSYILTGVGHGCCYNWVNGNTIPKGANLWYHASTAENPRPIDRQGAVPDAGYVSVDIDYDGLVATYLDATNTVQYVTPKIAPRSAAQRRL